MAIEKTIKINVDSEDVKELDQDLKDVNQTADKTGDEGAKSVESVGTAAKSGSKGVNTMSVAFKRLGVAMKASGILLIVGLFAKVGQLAAGTQGAMDSLSTSANVMQLVFNDAFCVSYASANVENIIQIGKVGDYGLYNLIIDPITGWIEFMPAPSIFTNLLYISFWFPICFLTCL